MRPKPMLNLVSLLTFDCAPQSRNHCYVFNVFVNFSLVEEVFSAHLECRENVSKMKVTLHGMTSAGNIVVDCMYSDKTHSVYLYKLTDGKITLAQEMKMNEEATMTLMPTDDFVYSDTGEHTGLISWHLPSNVNITVSFTPQSLVD